MIVNLPKNELSITLLHISNMRKEVKKGFKRTYGKDDYKEKMKLFDDAKGILEASLSESEESEQEIDVHFSSAEIEFLNAFLEWYLTKITKIDDVGQDGKLQIELLTSACTKLKNAVTAYA